MPLIAAGWFAYDHRNGLIEGLTAAVARVDPPEQTSVSPASQPAPSENRIVRLSPAPALDVPARVVARWSLDDPRFGRVTVFVPVGTTPRDALKVALAERGYQAIP